MEEDFTLNQNTGSEILDAMKLYKKNPTDSLPAPQDVEALFNSGTRQDVERVLAGTVVVGTPIETAIYTERARRDEQKRVTERFNQLIQTNDGLRFAANILLPNFSALSDSNDPRTLSNFCTSCPPEFQKNLQFALDILDNRTEFFGVDPETRRPWLMDLFNPVLRDDAIQIITANFLRNKNIYTTAIVEVHDEMVLDVPNAGDENQIAIDRVSVLWPHLPSLNSGSWDLATKKACIFKDYCLYRAKHLADIVSGARVDTRPYVRDFAHVAHPKYGEGLANLFEMQNLCEETKHGINGIKKSHHGMQLGLTQSQFSYSFTQQRLRPKAYLRSLYSHQLAGPNAGPACRCIEECNAKLTELAFGPDPQLSLHQSKMLVREHNAHMPKDTQLDTITSCDQVPFLLTLHAYITQKHAKNSDELLQFTDKLIARPNEILRLLGHHSLKHEFDESMEDMPFCAVDDAGKLVPHDNTLEPFMQWLDI